MRNRRLNNSSDRAFEGINVTPLIDVVMCLIVFFLIVGKLATDRGVAVNLPVARSAQDESSSSVLTITIAKRDADPAAGGWAKLGVLVQVDGKDLADSSALEAAVRGKLMEQPMTSVQVRADRALSFGAVEPILRAAGEAGAKSVRLATEKPG